MTLEAHTFLAELLDRIERQPDRSRRVSLTRVPVFQSFGEREAFEAILKDAQRLGAIEVQYGKHDRSHLVDRVILLDPAPLYRFLNREPLADRLLREIGALRNVSVAGDPDIRAVLDEIEEGWGNNRHPYGFGLGDPAVPGFLRSLKAVLDRDPADRSDLRTFSRRSTGDSKLVEAYLRPIASYFRKRGDFPDAADETAVLSALGLEKFGHPVLISGPVAACGIHAGNLPYAGFPPEAIGTLSPTGSVRSVLTIENLASYNRHVREAADPAADVVIYTGGFPARAVMEAIRVAASWAPDACFHWGDIDPSGVEIALHISRSTCVVINPHLMSPDLAARHGRAAVPARIQADGTPFHSLAAYLAGQEAHHMEQEELDPVRPMPS